MRRFQRFRDFARPWRVASLIGTGPAPTRSARHQECSDSRWWSGVLRCHFRPLAARTRWGRHPPLIGTLRACHRVSKLEYWRPLRTSTASASPERGRKARFEIRWSQWLLAPHQGKAAESDSRGKARAVAALLLSGLPTPVAAVFPQAHPQHRSAIPCSKNCILRDPPLAGDS